MIAAWLAGKVSGLIIFCLACLGVLLIPAMIVQTVRINGVSVFGWYAIQGYKPMYEADERDLATLRGNNAALTNGLNTCNGSIDALKLAGEHLAASTNAIIAQMEKNNAALLTNIAALKAIKSSEEKCPVADSILTRGFQ